MSDWNELEKPFNESFKSVQQSSKLLLIFCIICFILGNHIFGLFKKKIENKELKKQKSEQLEQLNYFQKELDLRNKRLKEIYTEQEKTLGTEKADSLKDLQELYYLTESSLKVIKSNLKSTQTQLTKWKKSNKHSTILLFFKSVQSESSTKLKDRLKLFNKKYSNEETQKEAAFYCSLLIEQNNYSDKIKSLQMKLDNLNSDKNRIEKNLNANQRRRIKRIERRIQRTEEEKIKKEKEIEALKHEIDELNTKIDKNEELSLHLQWFNISINLKDNVRYLPWALTMVFLIFFFKAKDFAKLILKDEYKPYQDYISLFSSEFIPQKSSFSIILRRLHYLLIPAVQIFLAIKFFQYSNKIINFNFSFIFHVLIPCLICFLGIIYWMFYERLSTIKF